MAASDMDETLSESEPTAEGPELTTNGSPPAIETVPEPPPQPEFDATPWPLAARPAARAVKISRPWGPRLWTATLAAALVFTTGGLALLYMDDANSQNTANQLAGQNRALKSQNKSLQAQLVTTQTNLTASLGELATVRAALEHPHLTIWNVPQKISGPTWYLAGGAPDTFTYVLSATSNGPMTISILTLEDFALGIICVHNGQGTTHWCMHHAGAPFQTWTDVTSVSYSFHEAEGCADYVVVFTSAQSITVTPNVSVIYNPAPHTTGACAS